MKYEHIVELECICGKTILTTGTKEKKETKTKLKKDNENTKCIECEKVYKIKKYIRREMDGKTLKDIVL